MVKKSSILNDFGRRHLKNINRLQEMKIYFGYLFIFSIRRERTLESGRQRMMRNLLPRNPKNMSSVMRRRKRKTSNFFFFFFFIIV